jgi:hypothetical protein
VSAALALYFGTWSAIGPVSALLVGRAPALLALGYEAGMVLDIAAFAAIAWGMTCPVAT